MSPLNLDLFKCFRIQAPDLGNTKPIKKSRDHKNDIEYCQAVQIIGLNLKLNKTLP